MLCQRTDVGQQKSFICSECCFFTTLWIFIWFLGPNLLPCNYLYDLFMQVHFKLCHGPVCLLCALTASTVGDVSVCTVTWKSRGQWLSTTIVSVTSEMKFESCWSHDLYVSVCVSQAYLFCVRYGVAWLHYSVRLMIVPVWYETLHSLNELV